MFQLKQSQVMKNDNAIWFPIKLLYNPKDKNFIAHINKKKVSIRVKLAKIHNCLRNRSALAVNCCIIIHCLEVSCKEDQVTSMQQE